MKKKKKHFVTKHIAGFSDKSTYGWVFLTMVQKVSRFTLLSLSRCSFNSFLQSLFDLIFPLCGLREMVCFPLLGHFKGLHRVIQALNAI